MKPKLILFFIPALLISCSQGVKNNCLTVTNWNVQTFFDANDDGIEYESFRARSSKWSLESYKSRLKKLCDVIEKTDSDIFIMEEIENEKIIFDISNALSHNVWFKDKHYGYAAFCKEDSSNIGCAVLSRYEIKDIKLHSLDVRTEASDSPSMRPVMELTVCVGKDLKTPPFCIFVNHWKSKSGGEEKSEMWRLWQESVLASRMSSASSYQERKVSGDSLSRVVFAAGDFNKDINDFSRDKNGKLYFSFFEKEKNREIEIYSPWDDYNYSYSDDLVSAVQNSDYGTYYFRGKWEKIDHFFFTDSHVVKDFKIIDYPELLKDDRSPLRYEVYSNRGYSDHLPITCTISYQEE